MKAKKMFLMMFALCCVVALMAASAHAANEWYTCNVVQGGPGWGTTYIKLSDTAGTPAFTDKWFKPRADSEKETLATAFTAVSNGSTVYMNADINAGTYPTINAMYLNP